MSATTPIQPVDEALVPRARSLPIFDPLLVLAAIGLCVCSYVTLNGLGAAAGGPALAQRQALYDGGGLVLALVISRFDYSRLREFKYVLFGLVVALNVVVFAMPANANAHRWIPFPLFSFQSSEFGKVLIIVSLAAFAVDRSRRLHEWRTTARIMLLAILPSLIVIAQPDLGTAMVYVAVGFSVLFFAGTSFKQIGALIALFVGAIVIVLVVAPIFGVHVLHGYQLARLTAFLNPSSCTNLPAGVPNPCYQVHQAVIAIGEGQKTGLGIHAYQTKLGFLPVDYTDFVFASVGETYGFVGAAVVLSLYALLIWRALRIVAMSKNLFGTLIAAGIIAMLMFQIFVNIGVTIGIMPVTGVPLPLVSYGGSSVVVTFIAIGLLESIYTQARLAQAGKGRVLIN
ncbi:MAG: FtsW/RodA/SpoVE family cell cycle protein [Solirubrobacteraceae bacterium]